MKIYVASSWRNPGQPAIVTLLRSRGHEVYDFRNPPGRAGFGWEQVANDKENWSVEQYVKVLDHPIAEAGYKADFDAMEWADVFVLVLESGRSAHTEAGWAAGRGKPVIVYMPELVEPELMYKMFTAIVDHPFEILDELDALEEQRRQSTDTDRLTPNRFESLKVLVRDNIAGLSPATRDDLVACIELAKAELQEA